MNRATIRDGCASPAGVETVSGAVRGCGDATQIPVPNMENQANKTPIVLRNVTYQKRKRPDGAEMVPWKHDCVLEELQTVPIPLILGPEAAGPARRGWNRISLLRLEPCRSEPTRRPPVINANRLEGRALWNPDLDWALSWERVALKGLLESELDVPDFGPEPR